MHVSAAAARASATLRCAWDTRTKRLRVTTPAVRIAAAATRSRREEAMKRAVSLLVARLLSTLLPISLATGPSILAHGQDSSGSASSGSASFPSRPIRMIVPFPAGGPSDIVARLIGQRMSQDWGQPVLIENRPGANTIIGAQAAAKAAPDGYTLFMAIDSTLVMNQYLYKNLPYDPLADFAPISLTAKTISVLAVSTGSGFDTVKELIARARAAPGKLNYGAGTITAQLMGHLFHRAAGMDIVYVPFKGTPETVNGLLTGSVELIYAANQIVTPLIASGAVRALAKLDRDAPPSMAEIPPLADAADLPDLEDISVWLGLVAPRGTPKPIIEKVHDEVVRILNDPALKEKSERTGNYPVTSAPEEFAAFIRKEAQRWSRVIKDTNIKLD
jgi:tripartite-type tricarboxylate transporter receptor subunit TctC